MDIGNQLSVNLFICSIYGRNPLRHNWLTHVHLEHGC